jgi:peroxiredoxin
MNESTKRTLISLAQVGFIAGSAAIVFSFVTVAREGEVRRRCTPLCTMQPTYAAADRKAPDFELPDMQGKPVRLSDYRGKVVVLNFWTKTCGPCLEEMPAIAELATILKDHKGVVVLTVSTDDGPDDVRDTLKAVLRSDPPFPVLFDPDSKVVGGVFGTKLYPETWIIDPRGVIRARFDGAREWSNAAVVKLVEQIRDGGYCPITIREGRASGEGARVCDTGREG